MITYTGIEKIDGGDNICILGRPKIQVAQPRYGCAVEIWFHCKVPGDD